MSNIEGQGFVFTKFGNKRYYVQQRLQRTRRPNEIFIPQARVYRLIPTEKGTDKKEISGFNSTNNKIGEDTYCFQLLHDFELHIYDNSDYNIYENKQDRCRDCYMKCTILKSNATDFVCINGNEVFTLTVEQYNNAING